MGYKALEIRPMLYTKQMEETIRFYVETLQFELCEMVSEWGWAKLEKDKVVIMLSTPNEHLHFSKPSFTGSLYLYVSDALQIWQSVRDKVEICYPIEDFHYGMREFGIFDNNGYLLQFGSPLPTVPDGRNQRLE
ncbi:MAG: hypothetical protein KTR24_03450 [Saprospiraceae bacterium]|nr:hypothetical protein [Saprospiraceae bacterium]